MAGIIAKAIFDGKSAQKYLSDLEFQVKAVAATALTRTALLARKEVEHEITKVFDRPTPFTQNSLYTKIATARTLRAEVGVKDNASGSRPAIKWMTAEIHGGRRVHKAFETLLQRAGVMGPNEYAIPSKGVKLDAYGNMPRGMVTSILSDVRAARDPTANSTRESRAKRMRRRTKRGGVYFSPAPGSRLRRGVYEKIGTGFGSAIRPVLIFTSDAPTYKKRLPFYAVIERTVRDNYMRQFDIAMEQAIKRAASKACG